MDTFDQSGNTHHCKEGNDGYRLVNRKYRCTFSETRQSRTYSSGTVNFRVQSIQPFITNKTVAVVPYMTNS